MSKDYKRSFKVYSAWNYQKEVEDLNKASEEGWQLVKGGCFHSKFEKNPSIRYRYQLDFGKIDNMARYLETYREQGWEYINSTFNGWHYFRKIYDPSLPEEAYEIFTDRESLHEMNSRWARPALALGIILGMFAILSGIQTIRQPNLPRLVQTLMYVVESAVLIRGGLLMSRPGTSRSRRGDGALLAAFFIVLIAGLAAFFYFSDHRPYMETEQSAASIDQPIENSDWNDFTVQYTDNYYLDLVLESEEPMTFAILDDQGTPVYQKTEKSFDEEGIRVRLEKGHYSLSMSAETGFHVSCRIE